jgi:glycyl-tRNA synthetase beta chain
MTADFLLELRCEEIPARMQAKASEDLARLFTEKLAEAGLKPGKITSYVTPRRLALIAHDLPLATQAVSEEFKGPRTNAPAQALEGFLRKTGLTRDQLEDRDGIWFATVEKPGRATADVLAEAIPAIVRAFPWPKSMRWGEASASTESLRWVRPLQGIIALLGEDVVDFVIGDVRSGAATMGHRFHHSGPITIGSAHDYAAKLRACHVIVDPAERAKIIEAEAHRLAHSENLVLVPDAGLVAENAGLTEWPVPLLGHFDPGFLEVPPEVIQLTLRINQKYFVLRDKRGKLAPAFICTANIVATDGGKAIVEGNGKVLAARLSDARFFWEQDKKTRLEDQAKKLSRITFHEKLGTVADKVERVAKLARWLVEEGIVQPQAVRVERSRDTDNATNRLSTSLETNGDAVANLANLAEQAARLCKADLVTEMVGEFPELQGLMGGYYAREEGLPDAVAHAIRDHYKPVGQGDDVPTAPITVAVSLADKLDTLVGFFQIDEKPTGSRDPFALRRAAIGILSLILENGLRAQMFDLIAAAAHRGGADAGRDVAGFLWDRLKVQQREAGVRHDLIDAVGAVRQTTDNWLVIRRVKALQAFIGTDDGVNLLAGYKRAANILKKENWEDHHSVDTGSTGEEDPLVAIDDADVADAIRVHEERWLLNYTPEPAEAALIAALDEAGPRADAAVAAENFGGAMAALAALRAPIDAFFEAVTVNDPDPAKRESRLNLLTRIRAAVHKVADFSKIEG